MSDAIYDWYKATKKLIKVIKKDNPDHENDEGIKELIEGWQSSLETMEVSCPSIRSKYDREEALKASFSSAQIDHICYMIGEWYIEWKDKMWVDGKPNQHRLGIAKEKLKIMICGDD